MPIGRPKGSKNRTTRRVPYVLRRTPASLERLLNQHNIDPIKVLIDMIVALADDRSIAGMDLRQRVTATLLEYIYPKQVTQTVQGPLAGPIRTKEWTGLVVRRGRPPDIDPADAQEMIVERECGCESQEHQQ